MDVKEAVAKARAHARIVFDGEKITIDEVWFDDTHREWCVTVGLQRDLQVPTSALHTWTKPVPAKFHYKTIRISDQTGEILSVKNHDTMPVSP